MLSIAIPTYNRADLLDFLIQSHIEICEKYNIQILISDNSSTDNTQEIIDKWQKQTTLVKSTRNKITVSPDQNAELALGLSSTKYTWLLGDSYFLSEDLIDYVIEEINNNQKCDLFIVNLEGMLSIPESKFYTDHNQLLADLGGIMTCLSCLIFHENIIEKGAFERYRGSRYGHFGVVIEYLGQKKAKNITWIQEHSVQSLRHPIIKKKNWSLSSEVIEVGFRNWTNFVFSLPHTYLLQNKVICLKNFGRLSNLATLRGFLLMRLRGQLTNESYKEYKSEINLVSNVPRVIIRLISIFPKWPIKIACKIATKNLDKKDLCL